MCFVFFVLINIIIANRFNSLLLFVFFFVLFIRFCSIYKYICISIIFFCPIHRVREAWYSHFFYIEHPLHFRLVRKLFVCGIACEMQTKNGKIDETEEFYSSKFLYKFFISNFLKKNSLALTLPVTMFTALLSRSRYTLHK